MQRSHIISKRVGAILLRARLAGIETAKWDELAHRYANACGCGSAGVFGIASVILIVGHALHLGTFAFTQAAGSLVFFMAMVAGGKAAGIAVAQYKLKRIGDEVQRLLERHRFADSAC